MIARGAGKGVGESKSRCFGVSSAKYCGANYRKEAAEDGWKRMQVWFRKHGVA
jgi:dienelactone hydrolase